MLGLRDSEVAGIDVFHVAGALSGKYSLSNGFILLNYLGMWMVLLVLRVRIKHRQQQ